MYVVNRKNKKEDISFDKILNRIRKLSAKIEGKTNIIDCAMICQKIVSRMYSGISTSEIDDLSSQICMGLITVDPAYEELASLIVIDNLQKNTSDCFFETVDALYNSNDKLGNTVHLVSDELFQLTRDNKEMINNMIDYNRDFSLGYFGFKTLERSYLIRIDGRIIERPQHMFMRVALGIHGDDFKNVEQTYYHMSQRYFTHATPTLFNAGTQRPQMSSCFLAGMDDSIESIFETTSELANISKWSGGVGLSISNIRATGSLIRKTNGKSSGIMPLLKMLNSVATYINQGGKRNGSFAIYISPYHPDILTFLNAKKNHGAEENRARDLFYALWVSDLFMERVYNDEDWSLLCPDVCQLLDSVYGQEFKELYEKYEQNPGSVKKVVKAREIWAAILSCQIETGVPYMAYKDAANKKSNQKNIGTLRSSNLCCEIFEYSDSKETAVCNLASICLPKILEERLNEDYLNTREGKIMRYQINDYLSGNLQIYTKEDCSYCKLLKKLFDRLNIKYTIIDKSVADILKTKSKSGEKFDTVPQVFKIVDDNVEYLGGYDDAWKLFKPKINYKKLVDIACILTINLNKIIDKNFYPTEKTKRSNFRHRPIGIGVQGLADLFIKLRVPFESEEAADINKKLFEALYYGAMKSSISLAKTDGPYETFEGSPLSQGKFQFDLWDLKELSGMWDWEKLREEVVEHGARNSLLVALMPTASTSQIMGNNECFEPYNSNVYVRRTLAGEFTVINTHLVQDLIDLDLWTDDTRDRLIYDRGSVQNIKGIPRFLKNIYKTVWEIPQKVCINLSIDRAPFICQSQSLNIWMESPDYHKLTSAHFHGWRNGLKTGSYYIRSKPPSNPQRFGLDISKEKKIEQEECLVCSA